MSFKCSQFRDLIRRVLKELERHYPKIKYSLVVENLLLGTAAQESYFGKCFRQIGGPALGFFGIEPATEADTWENYLAFRNDLTQALYMITGVIGPNPLACEGNISYQIVVARIKYYRAYDKIRKLYDPLPNDPDNIDALAAYWKQYYNTVSGKGKESDFIANYKRYVNDN